MEEEKAIRLISLTRKDGAISLALENEGIQFLDSLKNRLVLNNSI